MKVFRTRALVTAAAVLALAGLGSAASLDWRAEQSAPPIRREQPSSTNALDPLSMLLASLAALVFIQRRRH